MHGAGIAFVFPIEVHVVGDVDLIFLVVIILSIFNAFRMDRILNLVHSLRLPKLHLLDFSWLVLVLGSFKAPVVSTSKVLIYEISIRRHGEEVVFSPGASNGFSPGASNDTICLFDFLLMELKLAIMLFFLKAAQGVVVAAPLVIFMGVKGDPLVAPPAFPQAVLALLLVDLHFCLGPSVLAVGKPAVDGEAHGIDGLLGHQAADPGMKN